MSDAGFVCMVTGRAGRGRARRHPNFSCAAAAVERPRAARERRSRSATRPGRCGRRIRGTARLRRRAGSTHARASSTAAPGGPATPGRLSRPDRRRVSRTQSVERNRGSAKGATRLCRTRVARGRREPEVLDKGVETDGFTTTLERFHRPFTMVRHHHRQVPALWRAFFEGDDRMGRSSATHATTRALTEAR